MSKKIIEKLCNLNGISGHESKISEFLFDIFNENNLEVSKDNIGSIIGKYTTGKKGPTVAIIAHMDEVGLFVKNITDDGFVNVAPIGGLRVDTLVNSQVVVTNRSGQEFVGVILCMSPHGNEGKEIKIEDLLVDFGFSSNKEYEENGISKGDAISFKNNFQIMNENKLVSKAFDNRLGCSVIAEIAPTLSDIVHSGTVYLVATVQEEVGLRGAQTVMHKINENVDYCLIVDVSPVDDATDKTACKLGEGVLIRVADPRTILDYNEIENLRSLAQIKDIKTQDYFSKGGTDASMVQIAKSGFITSALCLPGRNLHSHNSIIDYRDYIACRDLTVEYILSKVEG